MFDLLGQTSKFEVGVWTSMLNLLVSSLDLNVRCPSPSPATCLFFVFFLFLSFVFFHAKLRSKIPTSPSSRSVSVGRSVGAPRIFAGERSRSGLQGGRGSGHHNVRVQDMDHLPLRQVDNRRLEVVVDGLPLVWGAQLAIDTTMVSPVRSNGTARRQCATVSGAALDQARRRKERQHGRARLVVLGCEVGGRWSEESRQFLASLAAGKARSEPELMRKCTMFCWLRRWCTLMACTAAGAFSLSLLERRCCAAADGSTPPTAEVVADHFRVELRSQLGLRPTQHHWRSDLGEQHAHLEWIEACNSNSDEQGKHGA